ncbi:hypothetical protein [Acetobacter okinawensis]|uniref:hypothetical protein n=1 Tax=Acetobacter okinawensis TaxID=1076594 RepID=UPI0039E7521E
MRRWLMDVLSGRRDNFRLRRELGRKERLLRDCHVEIRRLHELIIKAGRSVERKK